VTNLPPLVTDDEIKAHFEGLMTAKVASVHIGYDNEEEIVVSVYDKYMST
jgi:RNA recognition motif-containing protein